MKKQKVKGPIRWGGRLFGAVSFVILVYGFYVLLALCVEAVVNPDSSVGTKIASLVTSVPILYLIGNSVVVYFYTVLGKRTEYVTKAGFLRFTFSNDRFFPKA